MKIAILGTGTVGATLGTKLVQLPLWLRLWGAVGSPVFNIQLVREK